MKFLHLLNERNETTSTSRKLIFLNRLITFTALKYNPFIQNESSLRIRNRSSLLRFVHCYDALVSASVTASWYVLQRIEKQWQLYQARRVL